MSRRKVTYLAGPINGCTDDEATNWREVVKARLGEENCLDPMRRDYRGREELCTDAIVNGDKNDILASDIFLANCWQVSVGTSMEILYAFEHMTGVILSVMKPGVPVSPWYRYHANHIFTSLDDALNWIEDYV
jgi:hypothetical protein